MKTIGRLKQHSSLEQNEMKEVIGGSERRTITDFRIGRTPIRIIHEPTVYEGPSIDTRDEATFVLQEMGLMPTHEATTWIIIGPGR